MHFTADGQFTELEDLRVKTLSYHQSITASTNDSAESIAAPPPDSDLDDDQIGALLASLLYPQERGASAERSQVYHSERENLISKSSQDLRSAGKPVAVFSNQSKLNQDTFSDRQQFLETSPGYWEYPANVARSLLDGNRDHLLTEGRSELMKQEYKVESPDTCINEHQQQTYAQRLELEDARGGCVESRREQVRLQEELVVKEKALRETQVRSMHEMGEMKRAQELRVDEFSVQKLRESHDTTQKLTSQIQELQERVNCMNDTGESQDVEANYSGKFSRSSQSKSAFYDKPRQTLATWNMESIWSTGERFLATGTVPVHGSAGTPVVRG